MIYKDQFTPWSPEFDLSYDGLPMGDRGALMEHLAPNLKNLDYWFECHSPSSMNRRINTVRSFIELAQEKAAN